MEKLITKFNNINKDECFIDLNIFLDEIIRGDHKLIKHMLYRFSNDVVFIETLKSYSYRIIKTLLIKNDDILFYNIIKWMIKYNFYNMLAAVCIGDYFELSSNEIKEGIESYSPENNRSQVKQTDRNTLILDAYNANPTSVQSALDSFSMMNHDNKFFILGDMLELGDETIPAHLEIIKQTKDLDLKGVFVGKIYAEIAQSDSSIRAFSSKEEAKEFLAIAQPKGNMILLKGSRGIGLETLVDIF
jgi:UDP-N-acetylmuramoyl-tripeptide--D-alanyl-D-alanine ligase